MIAIIDRPPRKKKRHRKLTRLYRELHWQRRSVNGFIPCHWCARPLDRASFTIDHVRGLAAGGPDKFKNTVPACATCNVGRGRMQERRLAEEAVDHLLAELRRLATSDAS